MGVDRNDLTEAGNLDADLSSSRSIIGIVVLSGIVQSSRQRRMCACVCVHIPLFHSLGQMKRNIHIYILMAMKKLVCNYYHSWMQTNYAASGFASNFRLPMSTLKRTLLASEWQPNTQCPTAHPEASSARFPRPAPHKAPEETA